MKRFHMIDETKLLVKIAWTFCLVTLVTWLRRMGYIIRNYHCNYQEAFLLISLYLIGNCAHSRIPSN
jgi:hypothetical protein